MRNNLLSRGTLGALLLAFIVLPACGDFDAINTDPNNPTAVPIANVLPAAQMRIIFHTTGADPAWHTSVLVQHTAGVHAQLRDIDQLRGMDPTNLNTAWHYMYYALRDLDYVINLATESGDQWRYVGIAKVMKAYTWQYLTDLFGRVPYSEALQGATNLKPTYDSQEAIYADLQRLLDEAIQDLQRESLGVVGDLIYNGNAQAWTRAAYSLKARMHNRLSKRDPQGSATAALAAAANGFTSSEHDMTFRGYSSSTVHQHPWWRERGDRAHHAWGITMDDLMTQYDDPRREIFAQPMPGGDQAGEIVPAPNAAADSDQAGALYSKLSTNIIFPEAHQPLITFAELELIRADAHARLGQAGQARERLESGIRVAMATRTGQAPPNQAQVDAYIGTEGVIPGADAALPQRIAEEKWIALFPFQAAEAFAEWRRTGFPQLTNPQGDIPRRVHYAQREYDTNAANVTCAPDQPLTIGVWWDTGQENC